MERYGGGAGRDGAGRPAGRSDREVQTSRNLSGFREELQPKTDPRLKPQGEIVSPNSHFTGDRGDTIEVFKIVH